MSGIVEQIDNEKIVAILRNVPGEYPLRVIEVLLENGIRAVEITMNTAGAEDQIRAAKERFAERVLLGAGTVTSRELAVRAVEAGAAYLITPYVSEPVAEQARLLDVPVMMGALTPTEIARAMELGAEWSKIFPIGSLSPGYVKDVLAPMADAKLVAVGGVTPENAGEFIRNGAVGVGVGSSLVNANELSSAGWEQRLAARARSFVQAVRG